MWNVSEIDQQISKGKIACTIYKSLDLQNKAFKKSWNCYYIKDISTLEEFSTRVKWFIDLETDDMDVEWPTMNTIVMVWESKRRRKRKWTKVQGPRAIYIPRREVHEYFTPLNKEISVFLSKMKKQSLVSLLATWKMYTHGLCLE